MIIHNGKPIALYIRKLTGPRTQYIVMEKELISIVKTLKEFHTILLGQKLKIYTDHKNLTCKKFIPIVYYRRDLYYKSTFQILSISQVIKTYFQTHYHNYLST